jgi:hypothetical protein
MDSSLDPLPNSELLQAIRSGDPSRAMPALASLRQLPAPEAIALLLIGLRFLSQPWHRRGGPGPL